MNRPPLAACAAGRGSASVSHYPALLRPLYGAPHPF